MANVKFSAKAYCKMVLHAAKYPHCTVNGVLLAKKSSSNSQEIEFIEAVPLFHISINLTPMAEIALMQIDEVASKRGLVIAGYYVAPDNFIQNSAYEKAYHRIADKIASNNSNKSYIVIVNSSDTTIHKGDIAIKAAQYVDGNYKPIDSSNVSFSDGDTVNACIALVSKAAYKKLVDFDNHVDNLSSDWTNKVVDEEIECLL